MDQDPSSAPEPPPDEFRCPTCGARQGWADVCRRCKCDLTLVVAAYRRRRQLRAQCLAALRRQRPAAALRAARAMHALAPDADSARLVAVAHVLHGSYADALETLGASAGTR